MHSLELIVANPKRTVAWNVGADKPQDALELQCCAKAYRLACGRRFVAIACSDRRVTIIDLEQSVLKPTLQKLDSTVEALEFSHSEAYLIVGTRRGTVAMIDLERSIVVKLWTNPTVTSTVSISMDPEGWFVLWLGMDGSMRLIDTIADCNKLTVAPTLQSTKDSTCAMRWSPTGEYFALLGNNLLSVMNVTSTCIVRAVSYSSDPVSVHWLTPLQLLLGLKANLLQLDIALDSKPRNLLDFGSPLVCCSQSGSFLATAHVSGAVDVWHLENGSCSIVCSKNVRYAPTSLLLMEVPVRGIIDFVESNRTEEVKQEQGNEQKPKAKKFIPIEQGECSGYSNWKRAQESEQQAKEEEAKPEESQEALFETKPAKRLHRTVTGAPRQKRTKQPKRRFSVM